MLKEKETVSDEFCWHLSNVTYVMATENDDFQKAFCPSIDSVSSSVSVFKFSRYLVVSFLVTGPAMGGAWHR